MVVETKKIWLNKPQKQSRLIQAVEEYGIWGRATGKTEEPIANRSSIAANEMPRGTTGVIANTYMQLLDRTLPPLFKAWERFGYIHGVHYWVRQRPPAHLKIPEPFFKVLDPKHYIFWYTGHVFYLISQDRQGLANAKSLDAVVADEVKFLNHAQYMEEVVPANRGNDNIFGHLASHHMVTMYTDMPTKSQAKWILEKSDQIDLERVTLVMNIQIKYNEIYEEYHHPRTTAPRKQYLLRKLISYYTALTELRIGERLPDGSRDNPLLWYSEASTLENIRILGEKKFLQWSRELTQYVFDTSILNLKNLQIENGFFHLLDTEYHCYDNFDYDFIDGLGLHLPNGIVNDCRKDGDLTKGKPLDIAMDYNAAIKSLVIGQDSQMHYRVLKQMFVLSEDKKILDDLVDEFCAYYQHHNCKEVRYFYDHTAVGADASRLESYSELVIKRLRFNKWKVYDFHIGQAAQHNTRYRLWEIVFTEKDRRFKPVRFNQSNCEQLLTSMQQTKVRQSGKNGFEKDKTSETRKSVKPQDAPHLGDAFEALYIGSQREKYGYDIFQPDLLIL
jgi:hypothetical protein